MLRVANGCLSSGGSELPCVQWPETPTLPATTRLHRGEPSMSAFLDGIRSCAKNNQPPWGNHE
eukprot:7840372-Alexandrium_andersonii.AAC.1